MRLFTRSAPSLAKKLASKTQKSRHRSPARGPRPLGVQTLERRQLLAAEVLQIQIENLADDSGLHLTPVWVAVHDGSFDLGTVGQPAANFGGLEAIAEEGDVSGLVSRFASEGNGNDGVVLAPGGFAGAPVFEPGEIVTQNLTVDDTTSSQYFSFASMIIPSNDAFIANLNPTAIRLFNDAGQFLGPQTFVIRGSQIWDAGTEVNDASGGAAFATAGGVSVDENGVITSLSSLDEFIGAGLPTGKQLGRAFGANTPITRITISRAAAPSTPADTTAPDVAFTANDLTTRANSHEITVTYSDPSGVDLSSINANNLRITGPLLTQLDVVSVQTDAPGGTVPREVTATYRVSPASGSFTALDNGTYTVVLLDNQVNDPFGHTVPTQLLGEFTVDVPVRLNVTYESLGDDGGLAQTPVWIAAHDGGFEVARAGSPASAFGGLEALAEDGDLSGLMARFAADSSGDDAVIFAPGGFPGAPVFEPGETISQTLDVHDPATNRFFSYASMVIPSNDAFIANLDPRGIELFNQFGNFTGARTITIYGQNVWDAGTEVNDSFGAPFSTIGGTATDENGVIHRHTGLGNFVGTGLPTGETLDGAFANMTPIGRFTISLSDLPASPIDHRGPIATAEVMDVTTIGTATHEISVTYSDGSGVDLTSIDTSDLRVVSTNGNELRVDSVTVDTAIGIDARTVTATYRIATAGGEDLTTADNGLYFISLVDGKVSDTLGNSASTTSLGSFEIQLPVQLHISIENLSPDGGLAQTPFWVAVHEGNFELARLGRSASGFGGLEAIAEEGDVSGLIARFAAESGGVDAVVVAPDGFAGAPVFEPGEMASQTVDVFDTNANRFFSFASMIIPSNDAFIANLNPRLYELFDENGFFTGERTITIYGSDVWDSGTEVNGVAAGAAFSTEGGVGVDENGVIRRHTGLDEFIGSGLPTGGDLASAFTNQTPLARITISLSGNRSSIDNAGPTASLVADPVTVAGTASHEVQVTYNDAAGIDLTSIGVDDIRVTGPNGRELRVTDVQTNAVAGTAPRSVTATYTLATVDDQFTGRDNGRYSVSLVENSVNDTLGQGNAAITAGGFTVNVGVRLQVEIESLAPAAGLSQTPFWVGFHDGNFEVARTGLPASLFGGLELIAETGDVSELVARFAAESSGTGSVIAAPGGFAGAPVIEPGERASQIIEIDDTTNNRFFSYASMVIPSNDAFVANLNSRQYELFDDFGNFRGARQITIYGRNVLDSGTELNSPVGDAAFSTGGGTAVDENGVVMAHTGLDDFIGTGLPTGTNLGSAFGALTPLATITVTLFDPEAETCSGAHAACSSRSVSLQNAGLTTDVNRDGNVSPLDALLIINFLNEFGDRATIADEAQTFGFEVDVNGDTQVTALDALTVINELNRRDEALRASSEPLAIPQQAAIVPPSLLDSGLSRRANDEEHDAALSQLF